MKMEWNKVKSLNPKTSEISNALLDTLDNFYTEEYLYRRYLVKKTLQQS